MQLAYRGLNRRDVTLSAEKSLEGPDFSEIPPGDNRKIRQNHEYIRESWCVAYHQALAVRFLSLAKYTLFASFNY